jgi:hypothetical protein
MAPASTEEGFAIAIKQIPVMEERCPLIQKGDEILK